MSPEGTAISVAPTEKISGSVIAVAWGGRGPFIITTAEIERQA